ADTARAQIAATVNGIQPLLRRIEPGDLEGSQGEFAVQVGSFVGEQNASNEVARLSGLGFDAFRVNDQVGSRTIWRALVGPVADRDQARQLKARLAGEAGVEGLVISHP
ncbi:MAG: SPOR domain-containing protein, partial [Xanthomonadaceae bacterium]|nr:SPOR domain-containing protein [Xanthomonadaceae bacterium]